MTNEDFRALIAANLTGDQRIPATHIHHLRQRHNQRPQRFSSWDEWIHGLIPTETNERPRHQQIPHMPPTHQIPPRISATNPYARAPPAPESNTRSAGLSVSHDPAYRTSIPTRTERPTDRRTERPTERRTDRRPRQPARDDQHRRPRFGEEDDAPQRRPRYGSDSDTPNPQRTPPRPRRRSPTPPIPRSTQHTTRQQHNPSHNHPYGRTNAHATSSSSRTTRRPDNYATRSPNYTQDERHAASYADDYTEDYDNENNSYDEGSNYRYDQDQASD